MSKEELVVGIDLGTTNSEIAAFVDGMPQVLGGEQAILPSCVGFSDEGKLLVGESARNQYLVYPELTVRSIKRKMGQSEKVTLGKQSFSPEEISSFILRELAQRAQAILGQEVKKAIITVPAYFSDAQRNATRQAGELAGLEVVRILNEPTAASLAYGLSEESEKTVMIYDLGGGTFDVSIVAMAGDVTEVLASHGNNHLGGDDFDQKLINILLNKFQRRHKIDLKDCHPAAYSRLCRAAEEAKKKLSFEPYASVREESLVQKSGKGLHLDVEISREQYEKEIRALLESTMDSVSRAMADAGKTAEQIDEILLVGGSTRTPLVWEMLEEKTGVKPRQDVHPDLCVALGAGVLASRIAGHDIKKVLVDVSPFSFGPSYLGEEDGLPYPYCYHPIIRRNTPLPITRTESYYTSVPYQEAVEISIFQGENPDALKNIPVGQFRVEGLNTREEPNEILCRMNLNIDGILKVTAIEKRTGKSKYITISNAFSTRNEVDIAREQQRLRKIYETSGFSVTDFATDDSDVIDVEAATAGNDASPLKFDMKFAQNSQRANKLLERSCKLIPEVHEEDREDIIDLHERINQALAESDNAQLEESLAELEELLFFVEGNND